MGFMPCGACAALGRRSGSAPRSPRAAPRRHPRRRGRSWRPCGPRRAPRRARRCRRGPCPTHPHLPPAAADGCGPAWCAPRPLYGPLCAAPCRDGRGIPRRPPCRRGPAAGYGPLRRQAPGSAQPMPARAPAARRSRRTTLPARACRKSAAIGYYAHPGGFHQWVAPAEQWPWRARPRRRAGRCAPQFPRLPPSGLG